MFATSETGQNHSIWAGSAWKDWWKPTFKLRWTVRETPKAGGNCWAVRVGDQTR